MLEYLAYGLPLIALRLALIVLTYACIALGFATRANLRLEPSESQQKAFDVAYGAIFTLAALILAFSFSFVAGRFEARRVLIIQEANAIGTTYLRASYLPVGPADQFRSILRDYTRARLAAYTTNAAASPAPGRIQAMQNVLWSIVVNAARDDPWNVQLGLLTQTLNETIDISAAQAAALRSHMPTAVLDLVLVSSLLSAILLGVLIVGKGAGQLLLVLVFGLLLATVVTEVVDLDRPLHGLVRADLSPMQLQLQQMR